MRIPDYYCPHCGCNAVMKTRDEFKKFMDEMECKKSYECERKGE